jgi:GntR family transcriptional regulator, transcriptional repressor for pyruvate dehydrogenase complex
MTVVFQPIRPKKISEEIVEQIRAMISQGELKPGDRIPSERELAAMLGVSRPSVREAIMVLDAMGLVEARQGGGTYVRSLAETSLADPLSQMVDADPRLLPALVEVRKGLESWSACLAAQRADEGDLSRLRELDARMTQLAAKGVWDADLDARFHAAISAASHNTLQVHVLTSIHALYYTSLRLSLVDFNQREGDAQLLYRQHHAIFEAIAAHDPERARLAMLEHLSVVDVKIDKILNAGSPS